MLTHPCRSETISLLNSGLFARSSLSWTKWDEMKHADVKNYMSVSKLYFTFVLRLVIPSCWKPSTHLLKKPTKSPALPFFPFLDFLRWINFYILTTFSSSSQSSLKLGQRKTTATTHAWLSAVNTSSSSPKLHHEKSIMTTISNIKNHNHLGDM